VVSPSDTLLPYFNMFHLAPLPSTLQFIDCNVFQAKEVRPSIIFFDELDGLAPVRSSKQDQIHASIVCTLLALMDGLDSRGDIVIIGKYHPLLSIQYN
jgi:hypothetical protein